MKMKGSVDMGKSLDIQGSKESGMRNETPSLLKMEG